MTMDALRQHALEFAGVAVALIFGGAGFVLWRLRQRLLHSERERLGAADELNRRLSELFSLQELSYVLSDSLELDRIVEQVVRYAVRFLDARGALLALMGEAPSDPLQIAAAEGTLAPLRGQKIQGDDAGLIARSTAREHLELIRNSGAEPTVIAKGFEAAAAAAVPLRSHGIVIGTLVITDPREGVFVPEDIRLLSTLATHAAVVIANARFFEMVRRAKEQWETAFDALSEGIAVVDDEGRVRRSNRALASLLGMPLQSVVGTPLAEALLGKPHGLQDLLAATRRGERPAPLVARSERLKRTVRVNVAHIPGAATEQSIVVMVEDVTEQQALETQLVQSEKLAAVGQLVSGVAHELNNPLTSIAGLSEFLLEQKELGKKDRGHLQVIQEQAERAGRIVRNLLTFARKGSAERVPVDLNDVIRRTLSLTGYDLKLKDVSVERELSGALPDVFGDRHGLQQVVLNLVTNAAQAVAENPRERPRDITVSTWFDGQVHLRVADSGPGIPDEVAQSIFTPFFTTKEPGKGTGLGLSITYSIVESHGGQITLEPRSARGGAAFRVDLPPAPADAVRPALTPVHGTPAVTGGGAPAVKRTILLVDADPALQRTNLVITDARAMAPGKRGTLLAEELVSRVPALRDRIIVATGDVRPTTEETLARLGVRYVRKPFNLRDLRVEAARLWEATALS